MTDGGMYFCESGDQFKKFNTKDGMGIIEIQRSNSIQIAIISSAFKGEAVKQRAALLGIERCYVGRDKKIAVLETWMEEMGISIDEVAIIGDDVNDLPIITQCGFSACPSDAVAIVKQKVNVVLTSKGGEGCVRELIDNFILNTPLGSEF
jgi:3-deoxy-D-manno-octulosonate 8-phosphate phosphatase (KDO 8-P phosphatase)